MHLSATAPVHHTRDARLVRLFVGNDRVKKLKYVLVTFVCGRMGIGVWMGVGRPRPPIRNDIVTPRHLLSSGSMYSNVCLCLSLSQTSF